MVDPTTGEKVPYKRLSYEHGAPRWGDAKIDPELMIKTPRNRGVRPLVLSLVSPSSLPPLISYHSIALMCA